MSKKKLKLLKKAAGRQNWNGLNPVTKIVPDKKKAKPDRKAKHKGRLPQAGPDSFWVSTISIDTHRFSNRLKPVALQ